MREIKFRAWDGKRMIYSNDFESLSDYFDKYEYIENQMQYTCLKDKNGKEIYEGDIVRLGDNAVHEGVLVECRYSIKRAMYIYVFLTGKNKDNATDMVDNWRTYDIIGNIYENPELITH